MGLSPAGRVPVLDVLIPLEIHSSPSTWVYALNEDLCKLHPLGPLAHCLPLASADGRLQKEVRGKSGYHSLGSLPDRPWFGCCCVIWLLAGISIPVHNWGPFFPLRPSCYGQSWGSLPPRVGFPVLTFISCLSLQTLFITSLWVPSVSYQDTDK